MDESLWSSVSWLLNETLGLLNHPWLLWSTIPWLSSIFCVDRGRDRGILVVVIAILPFVIFLKFIRKKADEKACSANNLQHLTTTEMTTARATVVVVV